MRTRVIQLARRYVLVMIAAVVGSVAMMPLFMQAALAGGLVTSRSIQLSDSTPGGTNVTYNVQFNATSAATVGGILVDFCADSPIINSATCTFPTGFTLGTTLNISGLTGFTTNTGWTTTGLQCGAAASNFQVAEYKSATSYAPSSFGSTPINFQITGVTNTSTTGTFYARIYTFDTTGHTPNAATYCPTTTTRATNMTGNLDYGGVALSTMNFSTDVSLNATVQETLLFCVSKASPAASCGSTTAPTFTLGNGSSPSILDTASIDTQTGYTQVSSNASAGVVVALKVTSSTTCAGLSRDGGSTCAIPAMGAFGAMTAGVANFGLNVADGTGGTGTVTHNANYGTTGGSYGMRTQTYGTYGDAIESSSAATSNVNSTLTYAATAATTTTAGVYSSTEAMIATGTY